MSFKNLSSRWMRKSNIRRFIVFHEFCSLLRRDCLHARQAGKETQSAVIKHLQELTAQRCKDLLLVTAGKPSESPVTDDEKDVWRLFNCRFRVLHGVELTSS